MPTLPSDADHTERVAAVQSAMQRNYAAKQQVKIFHGASNSTRSFDHEADYVDASRLTHIIEINQSEGYAWVEPNVPFDKLVDATLQHGIIPPMVPEFPGITVGGAVQGGSGESSSFKYGCFHQTCSAYEIILGDGTIVTASATENASIFHGIACAFGSLGILTLVKVALVPAKPYVRLSYGRQSSPQQAIDGIQMAVKQPIDFVDAIVFDDASATVMTGCYSDDVDLPKSTFRSAFDEWFYLHAQKVTRQHDQYEELIPLRDYLFRYDRGAFWAGTFGFEHVPFNRFTRSLFAGFLKTRTLFRLLHGSGYAYQFMTQDLCMPAATIGELVDYCTKTYDILPLWLCPLKNDAEHPLSPTHIDSELVINLGLWGPIKPSSGSPLESNRSLEAEVAKLGGRKVLYAHAFYTEAEFWKIYDRPGYERQRKQAKSTVVFPDVYRKIFTKPPSRPPSKLRGLRALLHAPYKLP